MVPSRSVADQPWTRHVADVPAVRRRARQPAPCDQPERDRQPERRQPVEQGRRPPPILRRRAGQHQEAGQAGLDEPQPARGQRHQRERQRDDVREQHQERVGVGTHGEQRRHQRGHVEHPVPRGGGQRAEPVPVERLPDPVPLRHQPACDHRLVPDRATRVTVQPAARASAVAARSRPEHRGTDADQQRGEQQRPQQPDLERVGHDQPEEHRGYGEHRQRESIPVVSSPVADSTAPTDATG